MQDLTFSHNKGRQQFNLKFQVQFLQVMTYSSNNETGDIVLLGYTCLMHHYYNDL